MIGEPRIYVGLVMNVVMKQKNNLTHFDSEVTIYSSREINTSRLSQNCDYRNPRVVLQNDI